MHSNCDQRRQKLAQISQRARELVRRVDENLTDTLSLMDFNFSFDGLGQLYNDIGRTCEVTKLAKIPGKCVDLAKKLADEVSADWLGLDPVSAESEETPSENSDSESEEELDENSESQLEEELNGNSESQLKEELNGNSESIHEEELNESKEDLIKNTQSKSNDKNDYSTILGVLTCHSESTDGNKSSNQESQVKPTLATEAASLGQLKQNEGYVSLKAIEEDYHRAYMRALMPSSNAELNPNEAYENLSVLLNALSGVSESDDDNSSVFSSDKTDKITADENFHETVLDDTSEMFSAQVDVLPIEAHVDLNALVGVGESHDGNSKVDPINKIDETTETDDNLVNFSKPLEYGEFEDIDIMDDWEDDIDYDLDLVSYYQAKKSSKHKLTAKFISRLRHSKKSLLNEVAHKAEANTADSDWEIV